MSYATHPFLRAVRVVFNSIDIPVFRRKRFAEFGFVQYCIIVYPSVCLSVTFIPQTEEQKVL